MEPRGLSTLGRIERPAVPPPGPDKATRPSSAARARTPFMDRMDARAAAARAAATADAAAPPRLGSRLHEALAASAESSPFVVRPAATSGGSITGAMALALRNAPSPTTVWPAGRTQGAAWAARLSRLETAFNLQTAARHLAESSIASSGRSSGRRGVHPGWGYSTELASRRGGAAVAVPESAAGRQGIAGIIPPPTLPPASSPTYPTAAALVTSSVPHVTRPMPMARPVASASPSPAATAVVRSGVERLMKAPPGAGTWGGGGGWSRPPPVPASPTARPLPSPAAPTAASSSWVAGMFSSGGHRAMGVSLVCHNSRRDAVGDSEGGGSDDEDNDDDDDDDGWEDDDAPPRRPGAVVVGSAVSVCSSYDASDDDDDEGITGGKATQAAGSAAVSSAGTGGDSATSLPGGPLGGRRRRKTGRRRRGGAALSGLLDDAPGSPRAPAPPLSPPTFGVPAGPGGGSEDMDPCECERCAARDWCHDAGGTYRVRPAVLPGCDPTVAVTAVPCPGAGGTDHTAGGARPGEDSLAVKWSPRVYVKMTGIANGAVRHTFRHAGFRRTHGDAWNVLWCYPPKVEEFKAMQLLPHQRVNHVPGTWELGRKDRLARHLARMRRRLGGGPEIMPRTFVLPADMCDLTADAERHPDDVYIYKPCGSSRGRGVRVLRRPPGAARGAPPELPKVRKDALVQKYLVAPLLINGLKFDLRVYVLVTSVDPLRVYVFNDGLVRFATEPYSAHPRSLRHKCMHLTNYSVNKKSATFQANTDASRDDVGSKWSLAALRRRYAAAGRDFGPVWSQVKDIAARTLIAVEPALSTAAKLAGGPSCFEIFGFDIVLDATERAWLLEVNTCPALESPAPLDRRLKRALVANTLDLVGVVPFSPRRAAAHAEAARQQRLTGCPTAVPAWAISGGGGEPSPGMTPTGGRAGRGPRELAAVVFPAWAAPGGAGRPPIGSPPLPLEVRELEAESARCGDFERVLPAPSAEANARYLALYETPRHNALLLHKWLCHREHGGGGAGGDPRASTAGSAGGGSRPVSAPASEGGGWPQKGRPASSLAHRASFRA